MVRFDQLSANFDQDLFDIRNLGLPFLLYEALALSKAHNVLMFDGDVCRIVVGNILPYNRANPVGISEFLVHQEPKMIKFVVVDCHKNDPMLRQ